MQVINFIIVRYKFYISLLINYFFINYFFVSLFRGRNEIAHKVAVLYCITARDP